MCLQRVLLLLARNELPVAGKPHPVDYARILLTVAIVVPPVCGADGGFAMRDTEAPGYAASPSFTYVFEHSVPPSLAKSKSLALPRFIRECRFRVIRYLSIQR